MRLHHVIARLQRLAKPMALDKDAVRSYCTKLARKILAEASKRQDAGDTVFGEDEVLRDSYDVVDVRGQHHDTIVGIISANGVSPHNGFVLSGSYGRLTTTGGKAILVHVNGQYPLAALDLRDIESRLYRTLSHEIVHAQEAFDAEGPDPRKDPEGYYNLPTEVNAWLRNVLDELEPYAKELARILRRTPGEAGVREFAAKSGSWSQVSKHLSDTNQVKFLTEIWSQFHVDAKAVPASALTKTLRDRFWVKAYADIRQTDGHLNLSMLSDPNKDEANATAALAFVCKFADRHGLVVRASPGKEFAGSKEKAIAAYAQAGFVRNRGRTKDFTISDTMYRLPRGQKTSGMRTATWSQSEAERRFRELAAEIWGANTYETYLRDRITMSSEPPVGDVLGSVTSNGTQSARARVLRRYAPSYTLKLAPRFYDLPEDRAEGILKHEVLHLGYPRHDAAFNDHARAVGAPLTENESEGGKIQLQVKDGARFKTVREFDNEADAKAFVRAIQRDRDHEFFGKRMRLVL